MQLNSGIQIDFRLMIQFQRLWRELRLEFVKLWARRLRDGSDPAQG